MTLLHAAQSGQHPHAVRGAELYETPACATEALLRVERLDHWVWEPCAGRGAIATVLRDHGYAVVASDLIRYDGFDLHFTADFLAQTKAPTDCMSVVTNPPFRLINEFIAHAADVQQLIDKTVTSIKKSKPAPAVEGSGAS